MKNISLSISISLLITACGGGSSMHQGELATIDVETALQNPQELLLTDLGEKFTYVPLETTDESLVKLESQSGLTVTEEYIFVGESGRPFLCFDRSTGKFLRNIGRVGQGPREYSVSTAAQVDAEAKRIYFGITASQYQCYDYDGNFLHTQTLPQN